MSGSSDRPVDLPAKIIAALDRLARGQRAHRQATASRHGVTLLQVEILRILADGTPPEPLVGHLARELGVTQSTTTDSIHALEQKHLLARDPDPADRRRVNVTLTAAGERLVTELARADEVLITEAAALDQGLQEGTLEGLLTLIARLVDAGVVDVSRTCLTCRFHVGRGGRHRCTLLELDLPPAELRVNCPEHRAAAP